MQLIYPRVADVERLKTACWQHALFVISCCLAKHYEKLTTMWKMLILQRRIKGNRVNKALGWKRQLILSPNIFDNNENFFLIKEDHEIKFSFATRNKIRSWSSCDPLFETGDGLKQWLTISFHYTLIWFVPLHNDHVRKTLLKRKYTL